jgi:Ni/Fe-hydrogenase subunit HybB-like protein
LTACSRSASSNTRSGDLPPVSRVMFFSVPLACFITSLPVAAPATLPWPLMMLTTPGGKPASLTRLAKYKIESGVCSAGLRTTVLPHASAGPSLRSRAVSRTVLAHKGWQSMLLPPYFQAAMLSG